MYIVDKTVLVLPERDGVVLLLWILCFLFAGSNEESPVHSHSLQHVLRIVSREQIVEPLFTEVTVLLRNGVPKDLLKRRALQGVNLIFGEGERENSMKGDSVVHDGHFTDRGGGGIFIKISRGQGTSDETGTISYNLRWHT